MAKNKVFQDSTLGYIDVPEYLVSNIIDIYRIQRLKDVCQTGIRPLYSGATHDRFSHSMGVYHLGNRIYDAFTANVLGGLKDRRLIKRTEKHLREWKHLFQYACLLHDVGHPAFSHSLEYLYDSVFINLPNTWREVDQSGSVSIVEVDEIIKIAKNYRVYRANIISNAKFTILRDEVIKLIKNLEKFGSFNALDNTYPKQHELMGAYIILTNQDLHNCLREAESEAESKKDYHILNSRKKNEYLAFIARMIIGAPYDLTEEKDEYSLRNCIIALLNGKIDADSIDYLNRNSHFAGYSTAKLDSTRLCDGFSAFYDIDLGIFKSCMKKSALPTIDGFVQARNFEPKWLYCHHKLVYFNEVMIKYLVKMCGQYFFAEDCKKWEQVIVDYIKSCALKAGTCKFVDANTWSILKNSHRNYFKITKNRKETLANIPLKQVFIDIRFFPKQLIIEIENLEKLNKSKATLCNSLSILKMSLTKFMNDFSVSWATDVLLEYFKGIVNFQSQEFLKQLKNACTDSNVKLIIANVNALKDFLMTVNNIFGELRTSYPNYIHSLGRTVKLQCDNQYFNFGFSSDSHLHTLFLDLAAKFPIGSTYPKAYAATNSKQQRIHEADFRHKLFTYLLDEYRTRKYRKSLWKTYEEYKLFISLVADRAHLTQSQAESYLIDLMENGYAIDFENKQKPSNKMRDEDKIITNFPEGYKTLNWNKDFVKVFGFFGDGLIIRFHKCKFKDFSDINIQFEQYGDIYRYDYLTNWEKPKDIVFPYIFYRTNDEGDDAGKSTKHYLNELTKKFTEYLISKNEEETKSMSKSSFDEGKTIRDSVHGDIFLPNKFLKIIDCGVFQRLHRIKQLATADMIYPEAVHTRFAHSLGTFHITRLMMNHFCDFLDKLHIQYGSRECDVILVAALLHDIGHGPFSHAYERIGGSNISHEKWAAKIIREDKELARVLEENFGIGFGEDVIKCLEHDTFGFNDRYRISDIFADIISSSLDADRMDYLMRDAHNTGVKFGVIDLQKLISAMELVEEGGRPKIAIRMDAIPEIEQFLFGRYNMYSEVYFAPYKLLLEELLKKICERINLKAIDRRGVIFDLFDQKISLQDYLALDDYSFIHEICKASEIANDSILNKMLKCFMNRTGYIRCRMSNSGVAQFLTHLEEISQDINFGVLPVGKEFNAYNPSQNEILIVKNNGVVCEFSAASKLFIEQTAKSPLWEKNVQYIYYNIDILKLELSEKGLSEAEVEEVIGRVQRLLEKYDENRHTEIENKFDCMQDIIAKASDTEKLFEDKTLAEFRCVDNKKETDQTDIYYDSSEYVLAKNNISYRCRAKNGAFVFTVKRSVDDRNRADGMQFIRSEYDMPTMTSDLAESELLFNENLVKALSNYENKPIALHDLKPVIKIYNHRRSFKVYEKDDTSDFCCEVSLDSITYEDIETKQSHEDYQIEIELKCKYTYRLRMNAFAEKLCAILGISMASKTKTSKYLKALSVFNRFNGVN